jgi:hypothetical protein
MLRACGLAEANPPGLASIWVLFSIARPKKGDSAWCLSGHRDKVP